MKQFRAEVGILDAYTAARVEESRVHVFANIGEKAMEVNFSVVVVLLFASL